MCAVKWASSSVQGCVGAVPSSRHEVLVARAALVTDRLALVVLAVLGAVAALGVVVPWGAGLLYTGHLPALSAADALRGSLRVAVEGRWSDPASAFAPRARAGLPGVVGWWLAIALLGMLVVWAGVVVGRSLDARLAKPRLARRWFELTGRRPRSWAHPRDLRVLRVRRRAPGRPTLGTIGWMRRRLAALPETHIALVAPTGAGKSSRFIIPWVLQATGPVVVCSTKLDVVEATIAHRSRLGSVWVWDPFGPRSSGWSPLAGCESWDGALRRAKWMAGALGDNEHGAARFWNGEAAKLLAPLLHAAATAPDGSMSDVLEWLDRPERACLHVPEILERAGGDAAADQLSAVNALDDRNRGTTYMSAAHLVEAYRYPQVQRCDRREITPERFLDGRVNTLYIVAAEDEQEMLAPLVVGQLAELLSYRQRAARLGARAGAEQTLWLLLDETANIAPIEQLPKYLSGVRGANVRIVTVWQDHAQLRTRYRDAAGTILSNSQVKVYLGPITDELTRRYVEGTLGDERQTSTTETNGERRSTSTGQVWRPRASAQLLQQLDGRRALLVHTNLPAAVIDTRPWFADRALRRLAAAPPETITEDPGRPRSDVVSGPGGSEQPAAGDFER
jgi:type IV secretory pathway TraG/TraD family ATPase VirD4